MARTGKELQERKEKAEGANKEPKALAEEELAQVSGGALGIPRSRAFEKARFEREKREVEEALAAQEAP